MSLLDKSASLARIRLVNKCCHEHVQYVIQTCWLACFFFSFQTQFVVLFSPVSALPHSDQVSSSQYLNGIVTSAPVGRRALS